MQAGSLIPSEESDFSSNCQWISDRRHSSCIAKHSQYPGDYMLSSHRLQIPFLQHFAWLPEKLTQPPSIIVRITSLHFCNPIEAASQPYCTVQRGKDK